MGKTCLHRRDDGIAEEGNAGEGESASPCIRYGGESITPANFRLSQSNLTHRGAEPLTPRIYPITNHGAVIGSWLFPGPAYAAIRTRIIVSAHLAPMPAHPRNASSAEALLEVLAWGRQRRGISTGHAKATPPGHQAGYQAVGHAKATGHFQATQDTGPERCIYPLYRRTRIVKLLLVATLRRQPEERFDHAEHLFLHRTSDPLDRAEHRRVQSAWHP